MIPATRARELLLAVTCSFGLFGCFDALHSQPPPKWTTGFWYWHGGSAEPLPAGATPDQLYVHAGTIWKYDSRSAPAAWNTSSFLPDALPGARGYWLVFRAEQQGLPDASVISALSRDVRRLLGAARGRGLKVEGIQLDIDCPTNLLPAYAEFLHAFRRSMPADQRLSITALLDWFRDRTSVADVVSATDEFVPQFYDIDPSGIAGQGRAIAATIDAAKWAPRFNRFGKPYRIGISTFGRGRLLPGQRSGAPGVGLGRFYSDLTPADLAGNQAFEVKASRTVESELELRFLATRKAHIGYNEFHPGDAVEFTLATPDSVRSAVASARQMGGNCSGVVFFRWPATEEILVMHPDEVLAAAGLRPSRQLAATVNVVDGHCAAVTCVDLFLMNVNQLSSRATLYQIRSSVPLEYFLPRDRAPVRMTGPSFLEVSIPPYGGQWRIPLGRAVTREHAEFQIGETR